MGKLEADEKAIELLKNIAESAANIEKVADAMQATMEATHEKLLAGFSDLKKAIAELPAEIGSYLQ